MQIRPFTPADRAAVIELWRSAGLLRPWNDPDRDIDRKLAMQPDGFLVAERDGAIVGAVMTGYDGHRGWVNYLASEPGERHTGIGRALMQAAEDWLLAQGCPKLSLQVRADNVSAMAFYERLGYGRDRAASYGKRLIHDGDGAPVATPEPRQLVLASRNAKKARELEAMLAPLGWQVLPVSQFSDVEPEETGLTFVENALIKARHACRVSGLPAIADDSGLEVAALGGAPGVRSARFAGGHGDDAANNALLLERLAGLPQAQRGARFVSLLVCLRHAEDPVPLIAEGFWNGCILEAPRGQGGFGYDPLFYVPDHACASAELSAETKNRISHRARAMARLLDQLSAWA